MPDLPTRPLTDAEHRSISSQMLALREHFSVWSPDHEQEHDLLSFAYYEGVTEPAELLRASAPLALGESLVARHGCEWAMVRAGREWHFGVRHHLLDEPIDLMTLEDGSWNRGEYDKSPAPGERTNDSYDLIVLVLEWKRLFGRDDQIPDGTMEEIELQYNRRRVFGRRLDLP